MLGPMTKLRTTISAALLAASAASAQSITLYSEAPAVVLPPSTAALQERTISAHPELLPDVGSAPGTLIDFPLFGGSTLAGRITSAHVDSGLRVYQGVLPGEAEGEFLLVAGDTILTGEIRTAALGVVEIRPAPGGLHVLRHVDQSGFAPCATTNEHAVDGGGSVVPPYVPRDIPTARVLVVYTPLARDLEGGDAAIQTRIVFAINQANTAYANSNVNARLELAGWALTDYPESNDANTDLSRLRSRTDGFMDEVHCLRDVTGADDVSLLVSSFNACGIGYLQTNPGPGFNTSAFNVVDKDCIAGYTFAHEVGHNQCAHHDRDNAGTAAYPYAYGYRTPDQLYRTIMAYAPGTRVGRFSNPNITFNGYVMGDAATAYNALAISNTSAIVAAYRDGPLPDADVNTDGNLDQGDVDCLIDRIAGGNCGSPDADFNGDGIADQGDVALLINVIAGGSRCGG